MKNKVLINLFVPTLDLKYDLYIPINDSIKKVLELIIKSVNELSDNALNMSKIHYLMDPDSGIIYNDKQIIRETNIRNSKKIVLM